MIKIFNKEQLEELINYPVEAIKNIEEVIAILNENYGIDREVDKELGGCILIVENIVDIEILKQEKLKGLIPEYTDIIECEEGINWTSSLFLLSSDYAIVVVTTEELYKLLSE